MRNTTSNRMKITLATGGSACLLAASLFAGAPAMAASPASAPQAADTQATAGLPTIDDTWTGTWQETSRQVVHHPVQGDLEIRTYFLDTPPVATAPQTGAVAYAVYQDGRAVGFAQDNETGDLPLGITPAFSIPEVNFADTNVDREGNVYFVSGTAVVYLTPTDTGYDSHQTLPGATNKIFANAKKLTIDDQGIATVVATDEAGTLKSYTMKGGVFEAKAV